MLFHGTSFTHKFLFDSLNILSLEVNIKLVVCGPILFLILGIFSLMKNLIHLHFFFLMQPDKYEYTVLEGELISIPFQATVPIGCISSHSDIVKGCYQNFYIYQPKYNDDGAKCINNIVNRDIVFQTEFCGIRVGNRNWNETKHLNVYGFSDGMYNHQGRSTVIKFSTTSVADVNVMWKNINIADIKVKISN